MMVEMMDSRRVELTGELTVEPLEKPMEVKKVTMTESILVDLMDWHKVVRKVGWMAL